MLLNEIMFGTVLPCQSVAEYIVICAESIMQ